MVAVENLQDKIVIPVGGEVGFKSPLPEWDLLDLKIDFEQHDQMTSEYPEGPANICYSMILKRKTDWFVLNNMTLMFFISSLTFLVYGVSVDDLADRSSITLALLLTIVAQKFSLADHLPKLGYLTVIDIYIISCFALIIIVAFENLIIERLARGNEDEEDEEKAEKMHEEWENLDDHILEGFALVWFFW